MDTNGNLVITRRAGESFHIGPDITVTLYGFEHRGRRARIAINAPKHIKILRDELMPKEEPA